MNWKIITSIEDLPRGRTFLLWFNNEYSQRQVVEAEINENGKLSCPSSKDTYGLDWFTHWCEINGPDELIIAAGGSLPARWDKLDFLQKFFKLLDDIK